MGAIFRKAQDMVLQLSARDKVPAFSIDDGPVGERGAEQRPLQLHASSDEDQLTAWLARGKAEVFTVIALVGPTLAQLLLDRNPENRPVSWKAPNRSVQSYAEAMARGEWRLNGETVIIASTGELNDGQNRLNAILQTGNHVQMILIFGVERDTRHTVDQGIARTPGHILSMAKEKNANQLATALQFIWATDNGFTLNARPSTDQLLEALGRHPRLRDAVRDVGRVAGEFRLSTGYVAGAHYRCSENNAYQAQKFLDAVSTGLNVQNVNSPVARLRRMFTEHCAKRTRKTATEQAANYIKAYSYFVRGRTGQFVWRGNAKEAFPKAGDRS